jgi:hypothetical protein
MKVKITKKQAEKAAALKAKWDDVRLRRAEWRLFRTEFRNAEKLRREAQAAAKSKYQRPAQGRCCRRANNLPICLPIAPLMVLKPTWRRLPIIDKIASSQAVRPRLRLPSRLS